MRSFDILALFILDNIHNINLIKGLSEYHWNYLSSLCVQCHHIQWIMYTVVNLFMDPLLFVLLLFFIVISFILLLFHISNLFNNSISVGVC